MLDIANEPFGNETEIQKDVAAKNGYACLRKIGVTYQRENMKTNLIWYN